METSRTRDERCPVQGVHFLPLLGSHGRALRTRGELPMRIFFVTYLALGVVFAFGLLYVTLTREGL
jgi:hypothetical protein